MNRLAALVVVVAMAGCSEPPANNEASAVAGTEAATTAATASGTVEAVDAASGRITIAHGPVESLDWPAMTMHFKATPEQAASVRVGQDVRFEFTSTGMDGTIVSIEPVE